MSTASAPMEIGRVALTVNDLEGVAQFYAQVLGLERLQGDGHEVVLGAGSLGLLELRGDRQARRASPREAGLFHTAFLLPDRRALARWIVHASGLRLSLQGASDHLVSEAIYLNDPEGNGIEVYADRPRETWTVEGGRVRMATERLDLEALARDADGPWTGAPDGTVVGHVHLQVGDVPEAERFYSGTLGFPVTTHYPGAAFYGAGGYHHHLATNVWNSRGAGRRSGPATGLAELEIVADPQELAAVLGRTGGARRVEDPWGTAVTIRAKAG